MGSKLTHPYTFLLVLLIFFSACGDNTIDGPGSESEVEPETLGETEDGLSYKTAYYDGLIIKYFGENFYAEINGLAVIDDIVLGTIEEVEATSIYDDEIEQIADNSKFAIGILAPALWPNGTIPYEIDNSFTSGERSNILSAIAHVNENTLLDIRTRSGDANYIRFIKDPTMVGGLSFVGYQAMGAQEIRFQTNFSLNGMIHEIGHAAGLYHEHQRPDRDNFIVVHPENILSGYASAFSIISSNYSFYGLPYNYGSIMHYSKTEWTANGDHTIDTIPNPNTPVGSSSGLSVDDAEAIDRMYFDNDGDFIVNNADNCPFTPNPGQEDSDSNGVGDSCEDKLSPILQIIMSN